MTEEAVQATRLGVKAYSIQRTPLATRAGLTCMDAMMKMGLKFCEVTGAARGRSNSSKNRAYIGAVGEISPYPTMPWS
jgi:hypothetical protein